MEQRQPGPPGRSPAARLALATVCAAVLAGSPAALAAASAVPAPPTIAAQAAELLDARTGQVLYALNPTLEGQPASLAKMMTFDLVLKAIAAGSVTPATMIPVGVDAWQLSLNQDVSRMYLLPNVPVSLHNLLVGLMVPSGNDAALALADYFGGSEQGFVAQMNTEAQSLGLQHTMFQTSGGLPANNQYSTAADMALLARHIWSTYPDFTQYTDIQSFTWNAVTQSNYNALIGVDPRVNGLKSGYLAESGYHLVATATSGDTQLIAVVLGTATMQASADEDEKLLDWGFASYHDAQLDWAAQLPGTTRVWKGRAVSVGLDVAANPWVTLPGGGQGSAGVRVAARLTAPLTAPLNRAQPVGSAQVVWQGQTVESVPILAASAVARGRLLHVAWDAFRLHLNALVGHLRL